MFGAAFSFTYVVDRGGDLPGNHVFQTSLEETYTAWKMYATFLGSFSLWGAFRLSVSYGYKPLHHHNRLSCKTSYIDTLEPLDHASATLYQYSHVVALLASGKVCAFCPELGLLLSIKTETRKGNSVNVKSAIPSSGFGLILQQLHFNL